MALAPIVLFCYNRPNHLSETIEALKKNKLASESVLYVFADGANPNKENDVQKVQEVRTYLGKVTGFRQIIIECAKENRGLAPSVIDGVSKVINQYGKVIVLEDDILVSSDFLDFMNNALATYAANSSIYSVSGYSYLLENLDINDPVFLVKRASSWGWGTWQNRWESVDWELKTFDVFMKNKQQQNAFKDAGEDQLPMLVKQKRGVINSWAVRWAYHHFLQNAYCLVPKLSKVKNIGTDGSGTHFTTKTTRYSTELHTGKLQLDTTITANNKVISYIRNTNKTSSLRKIINFCNYGVW
jgi:glycosyltransferase involved in cell wall biosynthesis